jgi:hypothetical protein
MITFSYFLGQFAGFWAVLAIVFILGRFIKQVFKLPRIGRF